MKNVCSIKINNGVVYTGCIEGRLKNLGYDTEHSYMSDFGFCPWLLAYYDDGPKVCNCNDGMYASICSNSEFHVNETVKVNDFLEGARITKLPSYALF